MTNEQAQSKQENANLEVKAATEVSEKRSEGNVRLATGVRAGINPFTHQPIYF